MASQSNDQMEINLDKLNLDDAETWIYPKNFLGVLHDSITKKYRLDGRAERERSIVNILKAIARSTIFICILIIFISYYVKCFDVITFNRVNDEYVTNFTGTTIKNETFLLRIQFCSVLFNDKHYSDKDYKTGLNVFIEYFLIFYLVSEAILIFSPVLNTVVKPKYKNISILVLIFFSIIEILVFYFILFIPIFFVIIAFEIFSVIIDSDRSFNFLRAFDYLRALEYFNFTNFTNVSIFNDINGSIYIQFVTLFTMYTLKKNLKFLGLPGVLIIKHSSSIKKLLGLSILGTVLSKIFSPLINSLRESNLPLDLLNCSLAFNSSYANCSNEVQRVKVSDLSVEIRDTFYPILNSYLYENFLLNKLFPILAFIYCLFYIFIFFNWLYETLGIYKSDLEMARIEQHLLKYYSLEPKFDKLIGKILDKILEWKNQTEEKSDTTTTQRRRFSRIFSVINWITWKPFFFIYELIFARNEVDIALEKIMFKLKMNQLA